MTAMIPINNVALGTLPPERVKNASGLFNLTRNLRDAIGIAALTTILNDRTDLHLARLHKRLTFASKPALETLDALAQQLQARQRCQGHGSADADDPYARAGHGLCRVFFLLTLLFVALAGLR
jgi:MFS transporter, DHA2 family, multidrug resistance protein